MRSARDPARARRWLDAGLTPRPALTLSLTAATVMLLAGCGRGADLVADALVGVETVTPADLAREIGRGEGPGETAGPLVVDVRDRASYRRGHVPGAISIATRDLHGYFSRAPVPRDQVVVAVCDRGNLSREAAAIALGLGYGRAANLAGGMEAWRAAGLETEPGEGRPVDPALLGPRTIEPSLFEQGLIVLGAFVMKPAHMIGMLLIIIALRGRRERDLRLLRAAMAAFLVGEAICAVNYLATSGRSDGLELAHGLGMVAMGALLPWGLFVLADRRVLGITGPDTRCAALRLCGRCWKRDDVSCAAHRAFEVAAPGLALTALIPLAAPTTPRRVLIDVFGTESEWLRSAPQLLVEQRLYPALALVLLALAAALLLGGPGWVARAERPFFVGFGLLSFSLLRFFLARAFPEMPAWADFFEELTELLTVACVGFLLFVLRRQLGLMPRAGPAPAAAGRGAREGDERGDGGGGEAA